MPYLRLAVEALPGQRLQLELAGREVVGRHLCPRSVGQFVRVIKAACTNIVMVLMRMDDSGEMWLRYCQRYVSNVLWM